MLFVLTKNLSAKRIKLAVSWLLVSMAVVLFHTLCAVVINCIAALRATGAIFQLKLVLQVLATCRCLEK